VIDETTPLQRVRNSLANYTDEEMNRPNSGYLDWVRDIKIVIDDYAALQRENKSMRKMFPNWSKERDSLLAENSELRRVNKQMEEVLRFIKEEDLLPMAYASDTGFAWQWNMDIRGGHYVYPSISKTERECRDWAFVHLRPAGSGDQEARAILKMGRVARVENGVVVEKKKPAPKGEKK